MAGTCPGRPSIPAASSSCSMCSTSPSVHTSSCWRRRPASNARSISGRSGRSAGASPWQTADRRCRPAAAPRTAPDRLVPGGDGQAQSLGVCPADPGEPGQVRSPLARPRWSSATTSSSPSVIGRLRHHRGEPHRLQDAASNSRGMPVSWLTCSVGRPCAHRPAPIQCGFEEGERQPARPDRRRDPRHQQPGPLAGGGQADLGRIVEHVLQERVGGRPGRPGCRAPSAAGPRPRSCRRGRPVPMPRSSRSGRRSPGAYRRLGEGRAVPGRRLGMRPSLRYSSVLATRDSMVWCSSFLADQAGPGRAVTVGRRWPFPNAAG